jgi:hypothetical protein
LAGDDVKKSKEFLDRAKDYAKKETLIRKISAELKTWESLNRNHNLADYYNNKNVKVAA